MVKSKRSRASSTPGQDSRKRGPRTRTSGRINDLIEGGLSEESASELASSIVSLVSYNGEEIYSRCTGIVVENNQFSASFLTSKALIRGSIFLPGVQKKVCLPNREVLNGLVQYYSTKSALLLVTTKPSPHLRAVRIRNGTQVEPSSDLFEVSCCYKTGKLSVTSGTLAGSPSELEGEGITRSTCLITAVGSGGPLVQFDGNIVGMNLCMKEGTTPFVPTNRICECLYNISIRDCVENYSLLRFSLEGEALQSECTGMVIDCKLSSVSFLTTGSLFGSSDPNYWSKLTIKVRLPNDQMIHGWLDYYFSGNNLVVVTTDSLQSCAHNLHVACLDDNMQVDSAAEVLAVRRCFNSGKLVYTRGSLTSGIQNDELNLPLTGRIQDKELNFSTCKITEAASGGPLVDCDGNIVGMNYYGGKITPFLPSNLIFERLGPEIFSEEDHLCTDETEVSSTSYSNSPKELTDEELKCILSPWQSDGDCDEFTARANEMLRTAGYPLPKFADDGMYLKGTFDEEFGSGNWSEPTRRVASKMSRSVVALASFIVESDSTGQHNNEKRRKYSSCTGVFMECHGSITRVLTSASLVRTSGEENSIQPGLKIEVCLPSKRRVDGTLQHYDLHYNVAVVSIEGVRSYSAAKLDEVSQTDEVVALGRRFKSGKLLATNGAKTSKVSRFDCKELRMSTCKITKAGIGGPLVDFDGKFVGMNFYDMEDTPYLPRDIILEVMRRFDAERTGVADVEDTDESKIPSWPVPDAYWFYPSHYPEPPCPSEGEVDE